MISSEFETTQADAEVLSVRLAAKKRLQEAATNLPDRALDAAPNSPVVDKKIGYIFVDQIYPLGTGEIQIDDDAPQVRNPRDFEELSDDDVLALAEDIEENEQLAPVWVRPVKRGWELISGERRVISHKHIGKTKILARVFDVSLLRAVEMAIIEEQHKKGWSTAAHGRAYIALMALYQQKVDAAFAPYAHLGAAGKNSWEREDVERTLTILTNELNKKEDRVVFAVINDWLLTRSNNKPDKPTVRPVHLETRVGVTRRLIEDRVRLASIKDPELQKKVEGMSDQQARAVLSLDTEVQQRQLVKSVESKGLTVQKTVEAAKAIMGRATGRNNAKQQRKFEDFADAKFGVWDVGILNYNLRFISDVVTASVQHNSEVRADETFNETAREAMGKQIDVLIQRLQGLKELLGD